MLPYSEHSPWTYFDTYRFTSSLRDIRSAIDSNTYQQSLSVQALRAIAVTNWERNMALAEGNYLLSQQNATLREGNDILLGIAQMIAKANNIDISNVFPEYFPPPPVVIPPRIHEHVLTQKSRLDTYAITLKMLEKILGADRVLTLASRYSAVPGKDLDTLKPETLAERMVFNLVKNGRFAHELLGKALDVYEAEQQVLMGALTLPKNATQTVQELNRDFWQGQGVVSPIVIDINYADIPKFENRIIVGYTISTPPRYPDNQRSLLLLANCTPRQYVYFPTRATPKPDLHFNYYDKVLLLDADTNKNFPLVPRLRITDWRPLVKANFDDPQAFASYLTIFDSSNEDFVATVRYLNLNPGVPVTKDSPLKQYGVAFARSAPPDQLVDLLQGSVEKRILSNKLPQLLLQKSGAEKTKDLEAKRKSDEEKRRAHEEENTRNERQLYRYNRAISKWQDKKPFYYQDTLKWERQKPLLSDFSKD